MIRQNQGRQNEEAKPVITGSPPPTQPATGLHNKVSLFAYLFVCLNVLLFSFFIAANPELVSRALREDYSVEFFTPAWFLLAGLLFFGAAWKEGSLFRRSVYILVGLAMVFAAGEEVSWGQRVFGFATPDLLASVNEQNQFNVHNIANSSFDFIYMNGALLLCMATCAAFFLRKDRLFGIPLPSVLLMLGLLIILSYESGPWLTVALGTSFSEYLTDVRRSSGFIVIEEKALLLLFFIFALFAGRVKLVVASIAALAIVVALSYVNYENVYYLNRIDDRRRLFEIREYLFAAGCFFYALELALAQGPLPAILRKPFSRLKLPEGRIPLWLAACSLVIAGSAALMLFEYFNAKPQADAFEEAYRSVTAGEPVLRSTFDFYLIKDELIYVKEPCAPADTEAAFFLHLYPVDANDLPGHRKQHGFDNHDFHFDRYGVAFGAKCMAIRPLPGYAISEIRTGQYVTVDGDYNHLWEGEILLDSAKSGASE